MSFLPGDPNFAPYLALLVVGFLPSEIWRVLSVFVARRIDEDSEFFHFVRSVATVLVAGVAAKILMLPARELAVAPLWARGVAVGAAALGFFVTRRSVFAAVLAGEAAILFFAWRFPAF